MAWSRTPACNTSSACRAKGKKEDTADVVRTERAFDDKPVVAASRDPAQSRSWNRERRPVARIEAIRLGLTSVS